MGNITATVEAAGAVTALTVTAQPGWTDQEWDAAVEAHVSLSSTPLSWNTWTQPDGVTCWRICYRPEDVAG